MNELDRMTEFERLQQYDQVVAKYFREKSSRVFPNADAKHARIVLKHIFLNAQKEVGILSDCLAETKDDFDVYKWPDLIHAACFFLEKPGTKLRIIVNSGEKIKKNVFLQKLKDFKGKISLYESTESQQQGSDNYAFGDDCSIRLENHGVDNVNAQACAYSPESVELFRKNFDEMIKQSNPIPIT